MSNRAGAASLMDDMEFLAELEKFDATPIANDRVPSDSQLGELDRDLDSTVWETRATFDDSDEPAEPEQIAAPETQIAFGVGRFLLLIMLGAGAAALVFHDRVALLLR